MQTNWRAACCMLHQVREKVITYLVHTENPQHVTDGQARVWDQSNGVFVWRIDQHGFADAHKVGELVSQYLDVGPALTNDVGSIFFLAQVFPEFLRLCLLRRKNGTAREISPLLNAKLGYGCVEATSSQARFTCATLTRVGASQKLNTW